MLILVYPSNIIQESNSSTSQTRPGSTKASWSWPVLTVLSESWNEFDIQPYILDHEEKPSSKDHIHSLWKRSKEAPPASTACIPHHSAESFSSSVKHSSSVTPILQMEEDKKKPNQQTHPLKSTQEISDEAGLAYLPVQHVQYPLYNFKREGASW